MNRHTVRNFTEAYIYNLDCNLATVEKMACQKRRAAGEYKRQIQMAQIAFDWLVSFLPEYEAAIKGTRAANVNSEHNGNVSDFAKSMEPTAK